MQSPEPTETAFSGGPILTMDPARPTGEIVVLKGDRIEAVGDGALLARYPGAEVVDLGGQALLPGLIDAHMHLCIAALHPRWADLSDITDVSSLQARIMANAQAEPDAEWVRGVGWSDLVDGFTPTRHDLDDLGLDRPVIAVHYSYHECVVSSAGLDALEIGRTTPDPPGGCIDRSEDGEPTGILLERAFSAAHARSMHPFQDPDRWGDHLAAAAQRLLKDGITCVHDAACPPSAEKLYAALARENRLPISVVMMPHPEALLDPLDDRRLQGPTTGEGDEWVRVGPIKLFADGGVLPSIQGSIHGHPVDIGLAFPGLEEQVRRATQRGFRVAAHAIGNGGLGAALDAFEQAGRSLPDEDHRFRIEHATLASSTHARRMADLGVIGVVQPGFLHHMGGAVHGFELDDAKWMPFGELQRQGVALAGSSDAPCAFHEPVLTAARGVTRRTSRGMVLGLDQSLPYEDWLRTYTAGAAFAGGQEHERGRIAPGLRADLVVLNGALDAEQPPRVEQTWVAGKKVFSR